MRSIVVLACLVAGSALSAHELFFRLDEYFVAPGAKVTVPIYSGTFTTNENAITRDRLSDLSVTTALGRRALDRASWSEEEPMSRLTVQTSAAGTYVLGAALLPRVLALSGAEFDEYLAHEGLDQILAARKTQGRTGEASRERYSKFLKAVLQVGDAPKTKAVTLPLGYDAEIVPVEDPTSLRVGKALRFLCLVDGQPVAGQVAFAGGLTGAKGDEPIPEQRLVTDAQGIATVPITVTGRWYVRFVHMAEVTDDDEANYESKWSTLSFGVR